VATRAYEHFRGRRRPAFAHPSERELAELLDANAIPWVYEPHTFTLERDGDGSVLEAFTPDFFLPDADLYVELTTQDPKLGRRKRRKIRKVQERHGIVVTLHERKDFERLRRIYRRRVGR
jgi:hypothetical protein